MTEYDAASVELRETLSRLKIKGILYDLDDTLIFTSEIFSACMTEYTVKVAEETGLDQALVSKMLQEINDEEYKSKGVSPLRWDAVVAKMAIILEDHKEKILGNLDILHKIYTIEPRIRPGARETLFSMDKAGMKQGLITHANVEWTNRKMDLLGLWESFQTVVIVDENGHKGAENWKLGMDRLELLPEECLIIGDSLSGDIIPGASLGARTMWLQMGSNWSVYNTGKVPESTTVIGGVNELVTTLATLR
jgi:putative hydrolase of the HAD superfamily